MCEGIYLEVLDAGWIEVRCCRTWRGGHRPTMEARQTKVGRWPLCPVLPTLEMGNKNMWFYLFRSAGCWVLEYGARRPLSYFERSSVRYKRILAIILSEPFFFFLQKKKAPVAFVMCNGRLLLYVYDLEWCRLIFLSSCHYLTMIFFTLSPFFTM